MIIRLAALLVLAFAPLFSQDLPPQVQDPALEFGAEAGFNSAYVWRGIVLDNRAAVQPSVWLSWHGVEITEWNSIALVPKRRDPRLGAADLSLSYTSRLKKLIVEPGLAAYLRRDIKTVSDRNTMEGWINIAYPLGPVRVFSLNAFDLVADKGSYFGQGGVSYEKSIAKPVKFQSQLAFGWANSQFNDAYINVNKGAFNLVSIETSITYSFKAAYLRPHFEFSRIADRQLRAALPSPTVLTFGLALGLDF